MQFAKHLVSAPSNPCDFLFYKIKKPHPTVSSHTAHATFNRFPDCFILQHDAMSVYSTFDSKRPSEWIYLVMKKGSNLTAQWCRSRCRSECLVDKHHDNIMDKHKGWMMVQKPELDRFSDVIIIRRNLQRKDINFHLNAQSTSWIRNQETTLCCVSRTAFSTTCAPRICCVKHTVNTTRPSCHKVDVASKSQIPSPNLLRQSRSTQLCRTNYLAKGRAHTLSNE